MLAEGFAEAADVDVHGAGVDIDVAAPDAVEELFAGPDAAGFFHEGGEKPEFRWAEFDRLVGTLDPVGFGIERDIPIFQPFADAGGTDAAQLGADAGHELDHGIGFDNIVVGTGFQPPHPVGLFRTRGQHDDGNGAGLGPCLQATADLNARDTGQHPVEDDDVGLDFIHKDQRIVTGFGLGDAVAFGFEVIGQDFALRRFVLDHQNLWMVH